jgi:hypothetical protein
MESVSVNAVTPADLRRVAARVVVLEDGDDLRLTEAGLFQKGLLYEAICLRDHNSIWTEIRGLNHERIFRDWRDIRLESSQGKAELHEQRINTGAPCSQLSFRRASGQLSGTPISVHEIERLEDLVRLWRSRTHEMGFYDRSFGIN